MSDEQDVRLSAKTAYERLRAETCQMLSLGPEPSLIQGLQVDLIALLRLQIDSLQGAAFAGDDVDLDQLQIALRMLQGLLPESSLRAVPIAAETPAASDGEKTRASARLIRLVDAYAEARQQQLAANPDAARAALEDELKQALGERYSPPPAPAVELAAPSPGEDVPAAVEPPPTNVVPLTPREGIDAPMKAPPGFGRADRYEPWRDFTDGGRYWWPGSEPRGSREW